MIPEDGCVASGPEVLSQAGAGSRLRMEVSRTSVCASGGLG